MKTFFSFLLLFYFSASVYAAKLAYFELSRSTFSSTILETLSLNDTLLLVSLQNRQFFIYDLSDPESSQIQINKFETTVPFNDFKVSSDDFLIGIGNNLNKTQTIEIYNIKNLSNISHVSTFEMPLYTSSIRSLICLSKECNTISFVDVQLGIRLFNLTSKESPIEIPQPDILKFFTTYQTLVIENELIATFDTSLVVALNISNLSSIELSGLKMVPFVTTITSYERTIVFMTCEYIWTGVIYQWMIEAYDSTKNKGFYKWFASSGSNFVLSESHNYVCSLDKPSTIKIYDEFLLVTAPVFQISTFPDWNYIGFEYTTTTDAFVWSANNNSYISFIYKSDKYFKTSLQVNLSTVSIPYSIVSTTVV